MKNIAIYLDDLRNPNTDKDWVVLRSSDEAKHYVRKNGIEYISLDHDLGGDDTAMVFLKWLIDYDIDNNGKIIPENFSYNIHSANPVGRENMDNLLKSYLKFKNSK